MQTMDRSRRKRPKITTSDQSEEVVSIEWEFIHMSAQEEDLIHRMYRLVGERWDLIAGRIPGQTAVEVERFWIMRHGDMFAEKRNKHKKDNSKTVIDVFAVLSIQFRKQLVELKGKGIVRSW